ncbi:MAG: hypothetical protein ACTHM2_05135 [Afipia sp.]
MSQAIQTNIISPLTPEIRNDTTVNRLPPAPVAVMAALLRTMGVDLGDEREVIRVLICAKFSGRQVVALMDEAIALVRVEPAG